MLHPHMYYLFCYSCSLMLQLLIVVYSSALMLDCRPAYLSLPNCFLYARASCATCPHQLLETAGTPESDWKHKKTLSINCKLQTKADWKSIFPVSYSYRHQSSLITYMVKLQQSVTQFVRKSLSFYSKFQVKKVPLISAVPTLPGNMSGENKMLIMRLLRWEHIFVQKPHQLRMPAHSLQTLGYWVLSLLSVFSWISWTGSYDIRKTSISALRICHLH